MELNLVTSIISALGVLGGVAIMFRFLNNRINDKRGKNTCIATHETMTLLLRQGDEKFRMLCTTQAKQIKILAEIQTDIKWIKRKNGG